MTGSITISAPYGAHGESVGRAVAERLELAFLDRAIPSVVARQLHLPKKSAEALDERAPSRWDRLFSSFSDLDPSFASNAPAARPIGNQESFQLAMEGVRSEIDFLSELEPSSAPGELPAQPVGNAYTFRLATEAVMRQVADTTGAVILGRCGMVVLGGRDDVLCVRLDGPREARIAQVVAGGTDEAKARQTEKDVDRARELYASYFYKVRQDDLHLYHLIIDSTALPIDTCVDLVVAAAKARFERKVE